MSGPAESPRPLKVFISFSSKDDALREQLVTHLAQLERDGLIESWHGRQIGAGEDWAGQIDEQLELADIVLLLVSPDFLSSKYCYDIEMKRALERHAAGQAQVIPVILRPSDWNSAPFGTLQALPRYAKPIVSWKRRDDGFLDVAGGLRRTVRKIRGEASGERHLFPFLPQDRKALQWVLAAAVASVVALAGAGGWWWWQDAERQKERQEQVERHLATAGTFMKTGRYLEAKDAYQAVVLLDPSSSAAELGLKKAMLPELRSDREKYDVALNALLQRTPDDPDLIMLDGDRHYYRGETGQAVERYNRVLSLSPAYPEAMFRLGVLTDQAGDVQKAQFYYERAAALSPGTPHYGNNLAYLYYKQGQYDLAIQEYGKIDRYPLAALESAKAHWMKGELPEARDKQLRALRWLEDASVAALPRNQEAWYFEVGDGKGIRLTAGREKTCYAQLSLSATLFMQGRDADARDRATKAAEQCSEELGAVKKVLNADLVKLASERPDLDAKVSAYRKRYFAE